MWLIFFTILADFIIYLFIYLFICVMHLSL